MPRYTCAGCGSSSGSPGGCGCLVQDDGTTTVVTGDGSKTNPYVVQAIFPDMEPGSTFAPPLFYNDDIFDLTADGAQVLTLAHSPNPQSLHVEKNGVKVRKGIGWTLSGNLLALTADAGALTDDVITTEYVYYDGEPPPSIPPVVGGGDTGGGEHTGPILNVSYGSSGWLYKNEATLGVNTSDDTNATVGLDDSTWDVGEGVLYQTGMAVTYTAPFADGTTGATGSQAGLGTNVGDPQAGHSNFNAVNGEFWVRRWFAPGTNIVVKIDSNNYMSSFIDGVVAGGRSTGSRQVSYASNAFDKTEPWLLAVHVHAGNGQVAAALDIEVTGTPTDAEPGGGDPGTGGGGTGAKYHIHHGWDLASPAQISSNAALIDSLPLHGITVNLPTLSNNCFWSGSTISQATFAAALAAMPNFTNCVHNFLVVRTMHPLDFYNDAAWLIIAANFQNLAAALEAQGQFDGIFLDVEYYGGGTYPWNWSASGGGAPGHTLADANTKVGDRGKQISDAVAAGWVDCVILSTYGPWVGETKSAQTAYGGWNSFGYNDVSASNELMGAFTGGLADGAAPYVDGGESAYYCRTVAEFEKDYDWAKTGLAASGSIVVRNPGTYAADVLVGFGVYDRDFRNSGWPTLSAPEWETTMTNALAKADKYVWSYSEAYDWLNTRSTGLNVTPEILAATAAAIEASA